MCGIAGLCSRGTPLPAGASDLAVAMADALRHRGPDSSGTWADGRFAAGHRRLAILDLSESGAQPMVSHSGRYVVTYNGEIYNFRSIEAKLRSAGWQPQ